MNIKTIGQIICMKGDGVRHLRSKLNKLSISIKDGYSFFGKNLYQTVLEFEEKHGHGARGIVTGVKIEACEQVLDAMISVSSTETNDCI